MKRRRIPLRDRAYTRETCVRVIGPIAGLPTSASMASSISEGLASRNYRWAAVTLSADRGSWVAMSRSDIDRFALGTVARFGDVHSLYHHLIGVDLIEQPMTFAVAGPYVGISYSHALGDLRASEELIELATGRGSPPTHLPQSPASIPLTRALVHSGAAKVWKLGPALRRYRASRPTSAGPMASPETSRTRIFTWSPEWVDSWTLSAESAGSTWTAFVTSNVVRALEPMLPQGTAVLMPIDSRRYLRSRRTVRGNMSFVVRIGSLHQSSWQPEILGSRIHDYLTNSIPIVLESLHALSQLRRTTEPQSGSAPPSSTTPSLTISTIRKSIVTAVLDADSDATPLDLIGLHSNHLDGIFVYLCVAGGGANVTVIDHMGQLDHGTLCDRIAAFLPGIRELT